MLPVLASFDLGWGEIDVPAYGTFLVLAALAAGVLAVRAAGGGVVGLGRRRALFLYVVVVGAGLVGARALDVVLDWGAYAEAPDRIVAIAPRGFALVGGFAGAAGAAVLLARRWGVPVGALADSAVPSAAVGLVLLRIGCFLNGCCAGEVTGLPWGVTFPFGSQAWGQQMLSGQGGVLGLAGRVEPVHPTQLYEAVAAVVCALLATVVCRRWPALPAGVRALAFASAFLGFRVVNQAIRPDAPDATLPHEALLVVYAVAALVAAGALWVTLRAGGVTRVRVATSG